MPKIVDIQDTPNPNAKKFILREPLTYGVARAYDNAGAANSDSLASQLFEVDGVTNVFYVDHWITVTQDGERAWPQMLRRLAVPIRAATVQDFDSANEDSLDESDLSPEDRERLAQINEVLDERVRPYLMGDGGDIQVVGLEGNTLKVRYFGACGSCPSSLSGTLAGIENMLRGIEPELEVIAV
jgi:Fe-S cluster biogenesis protein NfuA